MATHASGLHWMKVSLRAAARATVFFLKVFPMLPSAPVDWVTKTPQVDRVRYPTLDGWAEGDLYRPPGDGPFPGILICLGVVPFGVDHPQVPRLGKALARAGFAALLYWSPAMRDFRLDPEDLQNIPLAYHWLIGQPFVDAARSGLLGTCVGGSFAVMAAAHPLIRDEVSFLTAYAPFSSMQTLAHDIASATRCIDTAREPWPVDQLTRRVFVHSLTAGLPAEEAGGLQQAFVPEGSGQYDASRLSPDGRRIYDVLAARTEADADHALRNLPESMQRRLASISPMSYVPDLHAPLIVLFHDRGDGVIPVSESRQLVAALRGRTGVRYTEMEFQHLDPQKGRLPFPKLARELGKFLVAMLPLFQKAESAG